MSDEVKLKVVEAVSDDVEKGIVRIDSNFMKDIGIKSGDIIEINGDRKTVAVADRAYPGDIGLNIIRMDGLIRKNAKTGIGELVNVKKASVKEAKKVTIAPGKKGVIIKAHANTFKQGLLGRPVMKGDLISLGGTRKRRTAMADNPFFDDMDIFKGFLEETFSGFGFGDLKFIVADTNPKDAVIISESTEIILNPEAVDVKEEIISDVNYEDIGGLTTEIKQIREMVELPLKHPEIFEKLGIEPPKGVLLHGPPGTGKTLLAKAVANESDAHFSVINGPEIMSKFYGESEANLRKFFEDAEKNAPSIIFIDEIDSLAIKREESKGEVERRVVAQLLALMDGLASRGKVIVIAATNIPNAIDPALRRPGRFDREISINVPDKKGRLNILKIHTRNMPIKGNFDSVIASKELLNRINSALSDYNDDLSNIEKKISYLKKKKHEGDKTLVERLLNKIKGVKSDIDRLKDLKKIRETKVELTKLISEVQTIENSREIWDAEDPRVKFLDIVKDKISNDLTKNIADLIELKIIDTDFYDKIREKSVINDLTYLADITYGFVGADLSSLAKESAMVVLRKVLPDLKLDEDSPLSKKILEKLVITLDDFKEALKFVRPSAMREVLIEKPNVKWDDIGGLNPAKQRLIEAVEWPLKNPKDFKRMGITPPRGILLYGAPGTGKTMLAKAVATESKANFILVKGPEMLSKWVGESEKAVREIFKKARQTAPTIIFFDEIDALAPKRGIHQGSHVTESVVNQLLTEMDGLEILNDVVIIAATNRPDMIDSALLRPGRFDRLILIPVPDKNTREAIFNVHLMRVPLLTEKTLKDFKSKSKEDIVDIKKLIDKTQGYTGSDIEALCREAAINALRKDRSAKIVTMKNFDEAIKEVGPSVTKEIEKNYESIKGSLKSATAKQMEEESPNYFG